MCKQLLEAGGNYARTLGPKFPDNGAMPASGQPEAASDCQASDQNNWPEADTKSCSIDPEAS